MTRSRTAILLLAIIFSAATSAASAPSEAPGLVEVGRLEPEDLGWSWGMATTGDRVYTITPQGSLLTFDFQCERAPTFLGEAKFVANGWSDFAVIGSYAFLGSGYEGIRILQLHNPEWARNAGTLKLDGNADKIIGVGDALVVSTGQAIRVIDVGRQANLSLSRSWESPDGNVVTDFLVAPPFVHVATGTKHSSRGFLTVLDLSGPDEIRTVGRVELPAVATGLAAAGPLLAAAYEDDRIGILDIADPTSPTVRSTFATPHPANSIAVHVETIYAFSGKGGMISAIDCSDPAAPFVRETRSHDVDLVRCRMFNDVLIAFGPKSSIRIFKDLGATSPRAMDGSYPGRLYSRDRTDHNYGADSYIFLDGADMEEFPLFSPDPVNAFRFATLTPAEVAAQRLEELVEGRIYLRTRSSGAKNILFMDRLSPLKEFHRSRLEGRNLYELQATKSEIIAELQEIASSFRAERDKVHGTVFRFEGRTALRERSYDIDAGMLKLPTPLHFLPREPTGNGWIYPDTNAPQSAVTLACEGAVMQQTFGDLPGKFGSRTIPSRITVWVRPDGGERLSSVYETMTPFQVQKITLETATTSPLARIVIDRTSGSWRAQIP